MQLCVFCPLVGKNGFSRPSEVKFINQIKLIDLVNWAMYKQILHDKFAL